MSMVMARSTSRSFSRWLLVRVSHPLVWPSLLPETSTSFNDWAAASAIRVAEKEGLLAAIVAVKTQDSKKEKIRRGKAES